MLFRKIVRRLLSTLSFKRKICTNCRSFDAFQIFSLRNPKWRISLGNNFTQQKTISHKKDLQEWGEINQWTKLEIVDKPSANKVEFKAFYSDEDGNEQLHHELSQFKLIQNRWYYVTGEFLD